MRGAAQDHEPAVRWADSVKIREEDDVPAAQLGPFFLQPPHCPQIIKLLRCQKAEALRWHSLWWMEEGKVFSGCQKSSPARWSERPSLWMSWPEAWWPSTCSVPPPSLRMRS